MSGEENPELVNVDPRSLHEALRTYFQSTKNDDPQLDFYAMYKRETTEYDTHYMKKYNEDLKTTLIFSGLFSTVSSAFVIAIQPELQPDSGERSEAYLRAIFHHLNPSIPLDMEPTPPPAWSGPSPEIITTLGLLYASLLMSLLAAFVAMLGKQWVNRYLHHIGGSTIERCGDRQRKFDGLEKSWFRFFIGSLPVMLQISLLLFACGLSRYVWSINKPVAHVLLSFTILGFLFYTAITVAGSLSYESPFQTPASTALRKLLSNSTPPLYAAWIDTWRRLLQGLQRFTYSKLLPTTTEDVTVQPPAPPNLSLSPKGKFDTLRKQNSDNARCARWVLRDITDPEDLDSAIRLSGIIRWFDGDCNHGPPFTVIVSIFEACFDSTKRLYPGMRNQAYFSARAILQVHVRARAQSNQHALREFPIPSVSSGSVQHTDSDLYNMLCMLEGNSGDGRPTLHFPDPGSHTYTHILWMSNLFVDLTNAGSNPTLIYHGSHHSAAITNNQMMIANTLLMWYMFFGGRVEDATLWVLDKSDSLEVILSHLSQKVVDLINHEHCPEYLKFLFEFLAAWKERPECITKMAYEWCSAISGKDGGAGSISKIKWLSCPTSINPGDTHQVEPVCLGRASITHEEYAILLSESLKIGFRQIQQSISSAIRLNHTLHDKTFKMAFSSDDDETIADAVCVWIADGVGAPTGSLAHYLIKRVGKKKPFTQRLKKVAIHVIEKIWHSELEKSGLDTVHLLNHLEVEMDDIVNKEEWVDLLVSTVRSPFGKEELLPHCWNFLGQLALSELHFPSFSPSDVEIMKSLDKATDWEKLAVWMTVIWQLDGFQKISKPVAWQVKELGNELIPTPMGEVVGVTSKLISEQDALPKFERLCEQKSFQAREKLQDICTKARRAQASAQ